MLSQGIANITTGAPNSTSQTITQKTGIEVRLHHMHFTGKYLKVAFCTSR